MSGVYIKGLKMPTDFSGTRLIIYPNGQVLFPHRTYFDELHGVEAIPVPDHGRLIDADEYRNEFMNAVYDELNDDSDWNRANRIIDAFDDAPTIIPASKEADT